MSQSPESSQSAGSPREQRSSRESQPELPSQQIESDKLDSIADPDRNNNAVARDENTGHNQTAAGLAPPAVDVPAVNAPVADVPPAVTPPAATAGSVLPATAQPQSAQPQSARSESGEPEPVTEQFPAVPPEATEPVTPAPVATVRSRAADQPHVRVDARLLEAALLNLRKRIAAIPLVFQISGSAEVKVERGKLLGQIDDYLLPRVRRSAAPVLVALVGSTGAGKSTLVNSIVGAPVSATGVRRPTTNSPVLACHPDEIDWFAENNFLPTLPRVRQEGLARPGRDGLLVLAASEGMPRGIALLDTPDIDSVVQAHHEFAYQFLDASDLWLFMTSASRYADGPVWEILQHARDRKASLGVVLSRIPQAYRTELVDHFNAMLDANGIAAADRFVIPEIPLIDGMLPADAYQPIRDWLADTADRADRRVAVLSQNDVSACSIRSRPGSRPSPRTSRRRSCCAPNCDGPRRPRTRTPSPRPAPG